MVRKCFHEIWRAMNDSHFSLAEISNEYHTLLSPLTTKELRISICSIANVVQES